MKVKGKYRVADRKKVRRGKEETRGPRREMKREVQGVKKDKSKEGKEGNRSRKALRVRK